MSEGKGESHPTPSRNLAATLLCIGLIGISPPPAAAKKPAKATQIRFAWLGNDPANTYDTATLIGIRDIAISPLAAVDPFYAGFDPATQNAQCLTALRTKKYSGLFILAASSTEIVTCVDAARKAGVPVVAVDLPIGPDPAALQPQVKGVVGSTLIPAPRFAQGIQEFLPTACQDLHPCNVLYLAGLLSFSIDELGLKAVQQVAAGNPSIKLIASAEALYETETARAIMADLLASHPEINLVIASGDQMALGVEQAATAAGVPLRILGAGAGAYALTAVREGRWYATFNAAPRTEGRIAALLMARSLLNPKAKPLGVDPLTVSGLPDWWTQATLAQYPGYKAEWPVP